MIRKQMLLLQITAIYNFTEYGSGKNLVRYITHDLIKRLSKQDDFDLIKSLTFNLSGEKKIRVSMHIYNIRIF